MSKPCIYETPINTFLETVRQNIGEYANLRQFWLPIIEARAQKHSHSNSAEDCLLNPIFRWCYLNRVEQLRKFEQELKLLREKLGSDDFLNYQKTVSEALVNKQTEEEAHNRMLDTRAEIRGMLHYAKLGHSITLEPRQLRIRTHDFNAYSGGSNIAVEAKFFHHPDKLREYLMRWWAAAEDISGTRLLGIAPYTRFKWNLIINKKELNLAEIEELKKFFKGIFVEPNLDKSLSEGRIQVSYSPNYRLPLATRPLGTLEPNTEHPVYLLIDKIKSTIEKRAKDQLRRAREKKMLIACYILVNIILDIPFEWKKEYRNIKQTLQKEYSQQGLEVLIEEVEYL